MMPEEITIIQSVINSDIPMLNLLYFCTIRAKISVPPELPPTKNKTALATEIMVEAQIISKHIFFVRDVKFGDSESKRNIKKVTRKCDARSHINTPTPQS